MDFELRGRFCQRFQCSDPDRVPGLTDRFSADRYVRSAKDNPSSMRTMRSLVADHLAAGHLFRISDEEVIAQVAELLVSKRLHIHVRKMKQSGGRQPGDASDDSLEEDDSPTSALNEPPAKSSRCCSVLVVHELTFTGNNIVEKDTTGNFPSPEWLDSRAKADQSPVSYARNKKISFEAKFKVSKAACQSGESVAIKGSALFDTTAMEWSGNVTVNPSDTEVSVSLTSNKPLPNAVGIFEKSTITWTTNTCNQGWSDAGKTLNTLYVTLGDPSGTPSYWTLLDISCRAAAGETTAPGVIAKAFDPLRIRAVSRKRDGHDLTYWNPQAACTATSTKSLLAAANGAGQCGSWAEFLVDMYKAHGIADVSKILIVRSISALNTNSEGFLVKHWIFHHPPASAAAAYTHWVPSQCDIGPNLPGQRNTAPPPAFFNHFIVRADGKFWDPSYGAGSFADQNAWEVAAIDGLYRNPPAGAPSGTTLQTGFDKSLNSTTKILEFWDTVTSKKI